MARASDANGEKEAQRQVQAKGSKRPTLQINVLTLLSTSSTTEVGSLQIRRSVGPARLYRDSAPTGCPVSISLCRLVGLTLASRADVSNAFNRSAERFNTAALNTVG